MKGDTDRRGGEGGREIILTAEGETEIGMMEIRIEEGKEKREEDVALNMRRRC